MNVPDDRRNFVSNVMNDLDRKVEKFNKQHDGQVDPTTEVPGEEDQLVPSSQRSRNPRRKDQKTLQAAFKGISREKYFQTRLQNHDTIPPIGWYSKKWESVEAKVQAPLYGTHATWGGNLAKKALKIKEIDFSKKVKPCARLDRTLVYKRNGAM